jgi:hypothetical protein
MENTNEPDRNNYIALEIIAGVVLSVVFIIMIWNSNAFWGKDDLSGLIKFYGISSVIFFLSVFLIGIIGAIKKQQSNKITKAILYSLLYWLSSLIPIVVLTSVLYVFSVYFMLIGIIVGFNKGLNHQ